MITWIDIAAVLFACTSANHLGLIGEIEKLLKIRLPIINCCKCFTFWATLTLLLIYGQHPVRAVAVSFLNAYLAVWLELGMGYIDYLYSLLYDKIYSTTTDEQGAANDNEDVATSTMPDL